MKIQGKNQRQTYKTPSFQIRKTTREKFQTSMTPISISHQMSSTHFKIDAPTFVSHQISFTRFKIDTSNSISHQTSSIRQDNVND